MDNERVTVTDIDIRFGSMVKLMVKFAIAAIPAGVILAAAGTALYVLVCVALGI